ncbi:MAG: sensor histidine kinase [Herminiimonas sp.]|nr:sensor histidine kinase [Herminiimonas sp.]
MPQRPPAPPAHKLLRLLIEQDEDHAVFLMDSRGVITDWFRGAEHIFGFTADEMVGQSVVRLFNQIDIDRGAPEHELQAAGVAGRGEDDRWHIRKDGTPFWGSGAVLALRENGQVVGFSKVVRNRTDVKTQTEAQNNRVQSLEDKLEQEKIFMATVSHELRNPLAPLANAIELIKRSCPSDPMTTTALKIIDRQMAALSRLVEDLLETARVETGKVSLHLETVDLKDVFGAAAESVRPQADLRQQELSVICIPGDVVVMADRQRLEQVFINLITNAVKYTPAGGKILCNLTTEGGDAIARVEDNGLGMGVDILPKVFNLFTQEETSKANAAGGLGIGLSLVRTLVQLHGGTVQARSDGSGKGSVFTVRLPLHAANQP